MVSTRIGEDAVVLRFGGGLNTRASEDEINEIEASAGHNFQLDARNRELRNRKPFDLLGTATNAAEIRGFATLKESDGTVTMLVQAGNTVYEWNGSTFTSRGTVSATAKLRGRMEANWALTDKVLIADLNLVEPLLEWDGTTLATVTHNLVGDFITKYVFVDNERAFYGNVISNAVATPHMLVGSERGDYTVLSTSSRPASGATATDPFFVLTLDLKSINGLAEAFGQIAMSSERGRMFKLTGLDKTDFAIDQLYAGSSAEGDESLAYVGNDIVYGRQGALESLIATDKFGDVESDDLSINIADQIEGFTDWTTVYNQRTQKIYFIPGGSQSEMWQFSKAVEGVSPWSRWITDHATSFNPTAIMNCLDPLDGLEYVFFGDSSGNLYRLEGSGALGDGGTTTIRTSFTSRLFSVLGQFSGMEGWIKYRKPSAAVNLTLTLLASGHQVFDEPVTISIPAPGDVLYYGGTNYYGGNFWYGNAFFDRITRQKFGIAGQANDFQIRVEADTAEDFRVNEVGLRFKTS